jgi:hypothetical protein
MRYCNAKWAVRDRSSKVCYLRISLDTFPHELAKIQASVSCLILHKWIAGDPNNMDEHWQ